MKLKKINKKKSYPIQYGTNPRARIRSSYRIQDQVSDPAQWDRILQTWDRIWFSPRHFSWLQRVMVAARVCL